MTQKEKLEEIYVELINSQEQVKAMMSMKELFDFLNEVDFGQDENHKLKSILDSINDTNSYIIAKFNNEDIEFAKGILEQRFAGLFEYIKHK